MENHVVETRIIAFLKDEIFLAFLTQPHMYEDRLKIDI